MIQKVAVIFPFRAAAPLFWHLSNRVPAVSVMQPSRVMSASLEPSLETVQKTPSPDPSELLVMVKSTLTPAPVVCPVKVATPTRPFSVNDTPATEAVAGTMETAPAAEKAISPLPPWIVVADVVFVDPRVVVIAAAPVAKLHVKATASLPTEMAPAELLSSRTPSESNNNVSSEFMVMSPAPVEAKAPRFPNLMRRKSLR